MPSLKSSAARASAAGLLLALSGCNRDPIHLTLPEAGPSGELRLVVTSLSGPGIDPDRAEVSVSASSLGRSEYYGGNARGARAPLTIRLPAGAYEVWTSLRPSELTRMGFDYYCDASVSRETIAVAAEEVTVLRRSFVCTPPGGVHVRTRVIGVDPAVSLRVQFAAAPGICDLEVPAYDPGWLADVQSISPTGAASFAPWRPGTHTMNLCGLPSSCPAEGASRTFAVLEDAWTEVWFEIRCDSVAEQ
jgi:hypothetical protein